MSDVINNISETNCCDNGIDFKPEKRVISKLKGVLLRYQAWREARKTRKFLLSADEHKLRDIGIKRRDISSPFDRSHSRDAITDMEIRMIQPAKSRPRR